MDRVQLSAGDVCEATGAHSATVDRWAAGGLLGPSAAGMGRGVQRRFHLGQALAVACGVRHRDAGADPGRVAAVVAMIAAADFAWLRKELGEGRTFAVSGAMIGATRLPGVMVEPPMGDPSLTPEAVALLRRLDVADTLAEVEAKVAALTAVPAADRGAGRVRASVEAEAKR